MKLAHVNQWYMGICMNWEADMHISFPKTKGQEYVYVYIHSARLNNQEMTRYVLQFLMHLIFETGAGLGFPHRNIRPGDYV